MIRALEPMKSALHPLMSRRLLVWTAVFGLFVLCDLALFGWLIFRSLSEREVNRVILEARSEAEELAQQIATGAEERGLDLYTAVATETETQTYIDSILSQRRIVEEVEIRDSNGAVIFQNRKIDTRGPEEVEAPSDASVVVHNVQRQTPYERVEVPVGRMGTFVIGISGQELELRLETLRAELLRQASIIGVLTIGLFAGAYLLLLVLFKRNQKLEEKAEEAGRLAYVGTLASGLAHEIRSPLNSLNLNMQMLEEEFDQQGGTSSGRRLTSITRSEIARLERLVTDFLSYARPADLDLEEVEAGALFEHVAEVLRGRVLAAGIALEIEDETAALGPGAGSVRVDPPQLHQLILNLADNALEACRLRKNPKLKFRVRRVDERVILSVEDNGCGIEAEDLEKMFELFYSKRKGGTGLGLAIVDRIVRAHDGEISVQSVVGEGTTVQVHLPAAQPVSRRGVLEETGRFLRPAILGVRDGGSGGGQ